MIRARQLGLRYNGGPEILSDISLNFDQGDFLYIMGPSGCGKTSLLRLLSLSNLPTRGELSLFGQNVANISKTDRTKIRKRIGIVFQDFRLLKHLSLFDNIALPLRIHGFKNKAIDDATYNMIEWVGLKDYAAIKPDFLSGGQQQRAAIARAAITKPDLLLADEPTGNLDNESAQNVMALFEEMNNTGTSVVMATHNEHIVKQHKHSLLNLKAGEMVAS